MAGYSSTPLVKKLGLKEGSRFYVKNSPMEYSRLIGSIPDRSIQIKRITKNLDFIHYFSASRKELENFIPKAIQSIKSDGVIWISWPKKSSKIPSDISEDIIREVALPTGLVDVKVCAVDETWSALKLVIRKVLRK